jgi:hypothetical protein
MLDKDPKEIDFGKVDLVLREEIYMFYPDVHVVGKVSTDGPIAFLYALYLIERKLQKLRLVMNRDPGKAQEIRKVLEERLEIITNTAK